MTFAETKRWMMQEPQPSDLDKQAYEVLHALWHKHDVGLWWLNLSPEKQEEIFAELRDAIRYAA